MQIFMCMRDSNFKTQDSRFKKPGRHISCLVPCTLYLVPCTLYLVPCTLYLVPCTLYLVPCTLYLLLSKMRFAIVAHANAITAAVFRQVQTPVGDAQQLIDGFHLFGGERGEPDAGSARELPAPHHIDSTHHMGKEAGHFHQYFIAGMVTEGVVDLLEVIDVE